MKMNICSLLLSFVGLGMVAAEEVNSFELPPGYSNEQFATDPAKSFPAAEAGKLRSYATLHSLGFEWDLGSSDTNHNAQCSVQYRRIDETTWHEALPLFRVHYAGWYAETPARSGFNMLAGSILFLRPGTDYLVRLKLTDPDGGGKSEEVKLTTRPVPDFGMPTRTFHVVPRLKQDQASAGDGSREKPFLGIAEAQKHAQPGDLMLLHAGDYGEATFSRSGEPPATEKAGAQPKYIVWKGAGDGPATFERCYVTGSNLWFEGLSFVRGSDRLGFRGSEEASQNVVRANTFRNYGYSIFLDRKVRGWYIADNDIIGDEAGGIAGEGIELNHSSDHTVCYNRISKTADAVSYCDTNCDIFANDAFDYSDDGVEPDYGYANNRIWGNRLDGPIGISFQPMYCGPWYIVRNQLIASNSVFKLRVQDRYLVANNTLLAHSPTSGAKVSHAHGLLTAMTRNNLWIHGGNSPTMFTVQVPLDEEKRTYMRKHVLFSTLKADWRTDVDYDGFDWSAIDVPKNGRPPTPITWNGTRIMDLANLAAKVGIEKHGRMVVKEKTFANYTPPPYDTQKRPTLLLRPDGDAVDVGVALPNIAEEFNGRAPDLGAFEVGGVVPHVGPRSGSDWRKIHDEWVLKHQRGS